MKRHLMILMALAMSQASCVSIRYSPVHADSPAPPPGSPPLCEAIPPAKSINLGKGVSCSFPIRADQMLTPTPLAINIGEKYRISVPRNQVWYDKSRRNVPPHGEEGSWMMNLVKHWKQRPESLWFALIAVEVGNVNVSHDVSDDPVLEVTRPGLLAFYPNDAIVPILGNFYSNNSGQVWVKIEHCKDSCSPKGATSP